MSRPTFDRSEGRALFGFDPAAYESARPGHPLQVYEVLVERCGLAEGARVLEIGPGTGQATRRLLELGARRLVAVEPDERLAEYLEEHFPSVDVVVAPLEDAELGAEAFDLVASASAFHWVDEPRGLAVIRRALRPGGWWAMWWTLFGEGSRKDEFMRAIDHLFVDLERSPSAGREGGPPFALDVDARLAALDSAGFVDAQHDVVRWTTSWDTPRVRALYSTFSPIQRLEQERREAILDEIARVAERDFEGRVTRTLLTSLYTTRRPYDAASARTLRA
jgi:SAM-dependent methyltransferase